MNDLELIALVQEFLQLKEQREVLDFKYEQARLKLVELLELCGHTKDVDVWRVMLKEVPSEHFRLKDAKEVINVEVLKPFITSSVQKRIYIKKIA